LTQIDQEFDVIPCHKCEADNFGYVGELGDSASVTRNFELLVGRRPRGSIKSVVVVSISKFALVVQDDAGPQVLPLEPAVNSESSTDIAQTPTPRIQIVTSVQRNGKAVWESNRILSRAGTFERKLKLADGSFVPVKLVFNMHGNPSLVSDANSLRSNRFSIIWNIPKHPAVLFQTSY
jgi:hypothetical protein